MIRGKSSRYFTEKYSNYEQFIFRHVQYTWLNNDTWLGNILSVGCSCNLVCVQRSSPVDLRLSLHDRALLSELRQAATKLMLMTHLDCSIYSGDSPRYYDIQLDDSSNSFTHAHG
jgi:hypothetical protein